MSETMVELGMHAHVDAPYEEAVERVTTALKTEGFGVLTEIDVKATLKKKLDVDFRRYIILGACNPSLAHRALTKELEMGLLLPCNVVVYEDEGGRGSVISIVNPLTMMGMGIAADLSDVAADADAKLRRVLLAVQAA